jgi:hypothetical protein
MKIKLLTLIFAFGAMTFVLLSGCTMTKINYADAPLTPVKFESVQASQTFYQAILAGYFPEKNSKSNEYSFTLDVPSPLWFDHNTRESYRVIVNEAAARADTDHDGLITEAEATAFASCCCCRQPVKKEEVEDQK